MTPPSTSEIRAWAQANGYDVGDRGRLPAEVVAAYKKKRPAAANPSAAKPKSAAKTATKSAPRTATKPAPKPKATDARRLAVLIDDADDADDAPDAPDARSAQQAAPAAKDSALQLLGGRVSDLEKQVESLSGKVAALQAARMQSPKKGFGFRRDRA